MPDLLDICLKIFLPMIGVQLVCRLADIKGALGKFALRLLPTSGRAIAMLIVGNAAVILLGGAAAFLLRAGMSRYFIVCSALVGLVTAFSLSAMRAADKADDIG